ncbi:MAG: glycoside hydrolase family 99-like domain-containing protein [Myxococcales bacterium]|nr:glycoside hydrolase family 99-like domain-containing protein [Myxococcota bacterium]MDW8280330.1 glycoside hydrolase family 99-like domain-containing protein [Myxococcales bacterium]
MSDVKYIAMHLPQFHPIPENDAWWGRGFTEWTNVVRARPRFRGHYQPHLPADLGFYDLRLPEARAAQAELAARYGIDAFCYYHYWFGGRRLLERPVNEILASGEPDFPFCLCWANENWSRRWDGGDNQVLMRQEYSEADDRAHFEWLLTAFRDRRYVRIEGRPLFLIYRAHEVATLPHLVRSWQQWAQEAGLPGLFLVSVRNAWNESFNPLQHGLQASMKFQPFWRHVDRLAQGLLERAAYGLIQAHAPQLGPLLKRVLSGRRGDRVIAYRDLVAAEMASRSADFPEFPSVTPGWDNSPRRARGATIVHGSTPALFGRWLRHETQRVRRLPPPLRIVFLNAWNEWGEGNHLEPDQRFGLAYLEEVKRAR